MPGAMIKCSAEQLRHRTVEEKAADRVILRDLRAAAVNLFSDGSGGHRHQKGFMDITADGFPPGEHQAAPPPPPPAEEEEV
jgi:hypothetical protein